MIIISINNHDDNSQLFFLIFVHPNLTTLNLSMGHWGRSQDFLGVMCLLCIFTVFKKHFAKYRNTLCTKQGGKPGTRVQIPFLQSIKKSSWRRIIHESIYNKPLGHSYQRVVNVINTIVGFFSFLKLFTIKIPISKLRRKSHF